MWVLGTPMYRPGHVLAQTSGKGFWSRAVAFVTRSRWTHVALIVDPFTIVEAEFPSSVQPYSLQQRLEELQADGREYAILAPVNLTREQERLVASTALTYYGRRYDVLQCVLYALFGRFIKDGPLRVICTRLVTAVYQDIGMHGFDAYMAPHELVNHPLMRRVTK